MPMELLSQTDSRKKPQYEVIGLLRTKGGQSTLKYNNQQKDKEFPPLNSIIATMLEKDSRAGMLDCVEEVSSLASENTRTSNYCSRSNNRDSTSGGFHSNGPILDDKNAALGENLYSYSLVPISQADNDLSFFDSNHEDKNTTDLLYYSWPEMENFEDVDRMFRSCDSTFGFGASIEDALGLFSSSDVIEGSGGGLRSDFEFPCPSSSALENISGSQEASRRKETCSSINDSGTKDDPFSHTGSSMPSEDDSAFLNHLYFLNGSSDSDCKIVPKKKVAGIGTNENMAEKLLHHSGVKHDNNRDLGSVCTGIPAELGSSIVKESSCISFGLNEISEEAKSFHQLQRVMERLDIRTKLRIRDSLYRLAQSAEQRLRYANLNNGSGDNRSTSGAFVDDGAYRCAGYLDMETNTNSIDRSIAHLLFHRPSNSSVMPDSLALKSPSMIYGSSSSPQMIAENSISAVENAAETDKRNC